MSAQITHGDLERWWRFAASFSGNNNPFRPGGGQFVNEHQPAEFLCLTCTGDRQPGDDPEERVLPSVSNRPIMIPVFVAGGPSEQDAINQLGSNITTTLKINGADKTPVMVNGDVNGLAFPPDNPFNEAPGNNSHYSTRGFWFKIPANETDDVDTIEFGGSSSSFTTHVKYRRS